MSVTFDTSDFDKKIKDLGKRVEDQSRKIIGEIADEVLRLGSFEVPHDKGLLQASGHSEPDGDDRIVGYNKVYAARLHEHPEYKFQKGRKGKYLEDPMKNNAGVFLNFYKEGMESLLK